MDKIKSITFFYPSRMLGGVEFLFIRLAKYLSEELNMKVFYIDYEDGFGKKQLSSSDVTFIKYEDSSKNILLDFDTHLILPLFKLFAHNELIITNRVRLLFWSLHPFDIIYVFSFLKLYMNYISDKKESLKKAINFLYRKDVSIITKVLKLCDKKNSLYFMDSVNFDVKNFCLDLNLDEAKYIPIPVLEKNHNPKREIVDENVINIGWVGRLCDFKVFILMNIIENANIYSHKTAKKVKVHIIGTGPEEIRVRNYKKTGNIELLFLGSLIEDELDNYLINNIDVLFAMGTSCLEGAKLHIPSVLVDASYKKIPLSYKFKWLFETTGFSLGESINKVNNKNSHTFNKILSEIYLKKNKKYIGDKCYSYCKSNHAIDSVANKLIDYLNETSLTISDLFITGIDKAKVNKIKNFKKIVKGNMIYSLIKSLKQTG